MFDIFDMLSIMKKGTAHGKVAQAIKRGQLPKLDGSIACIDCGLPAQCYDHRDYSKPLEVEPVCFSCNWYRGQGKNRQQDSIQVWVDISDGDYARAKANAALQGISLAKWFGKLVARNL